MAPQWSGSSGKHEISQTDAVHAILNATYTAVLEDEVDEGHVTLFIGPRHAQALPEDEIEILVHEFPGTNRQAVIFHVMPLGPKFRRYREEKPT